MESSLSEKNEKDSSVKQGYSPLFSILISFLGLNLLLKVNLFLPLYLYTVIPWFYTHGIWGLQNSFLLLVTFEEPDKKEANELMFMISEKPPYSFWTIHGLCTWAI